MANGVTSTSFTDTGLVGNTVYYYEVTALNSSGESARSREVGAVVPKVGTTTALAGSPNPSVFGQFVTFTATVTASVTTAAVPTGAVSFQEGQTILGTVPLNAASKAIFRTTATGPGTVSLTAVYSGSASFVASSSAPVSQTINQDASVAVVKTSANPAVFGQTLTLTAIVSAAPPGSGIPTGTVTFEDFGNTLGAGTLVGGQATFTTASLAVGNHSLIASYGGDTRFTASTSRGYGEKVNVMAVKLETGALATPVAPQKAATASGESLLPAGRSHAAPSANSVDAFFSSPRSTTGHVRLLPTPPEAASHLDCGLALNVSYSCRKNATRSFFSSLVSFVSRTRLKNSTASSSVKSRPSWK